METNELVRIIGCGQMGSALAAGMVEGRALDPANLYLVDSDRDAAEQLADNLGAQVDDAGGDRSGRAIHILAVKPKDISKALDEQNSRIRAEDIVVSIAAGTPTSKIRGELDRSASVVRGMPNTPALIGEGITALYSDDETALEGVRPLFEAAGEVVELGDESDFHAVTALSGSGPAFVFVMLEALADGAVQMGVDRESARKLAEQTLRGSTTLAIESDEHTGELKDQVTSPGGTTAAGLGELEDRGLRGTLMAAVRRAARRSLEMSTSGNE